MSAASSFCIWRAIAAVARGAPASPSAVRI